MKRSFLFNCVPKQNLGTRGNPKKLSKIDEENQVFKILLTSSAIDRQAVNPGESIPIKFIKLGYPFSDSSLI